MGIGDWGNAQCPIPNLIIKINNLLNKFKIYNIYNIILKIKFNKFILLNNLSHLSLVVHFLLHLNLHQYYLYLIYNYH